MDASHLEQLLKEPEGQLLEFKRQWYELSSGRGKAEFARDVLAMANGLDSGQVGYIIIGREDPAPGGHPKVLHPWPGQNPPPSGGGNGARYVTAMRLGAQPWRLLRGASSSCLRT